MKICITFNPKQKTTTNKVSIKTKTAREFILSRYKYLMIYMLNALF